jgi:hypothetical protein
VTREFDIEVRTEELGLSLFEKVKMMKYMTARGKKNEKKSLKVVFLLPLFRAGVLQEFLTDFKN